MTSDTNEARRAEYWALFDQYRQEMLAECEAIERRARRRSTLILALILVSGAAILVAVGLRLQHGDVAGAAVSAAILLPLSSVYHREMEYRREWRW